LLDPQQSDLEQYLTTAETFTLQARQLAEQLHQPSILYQWDAQLGDIYRKQARIKANAPTLVAKAIKFYRAAVSSVDSVRQDLLAIDPETQFTFQTNIEQVYRHLIGILLVTPEPHQKIDPEHLRQVLQTTVQLQKVELENFLQCSLEELNRTSSPKAQGTKELQDSAQDRSWWPAKSKFTQTEANPAVSQSPSGKIATIYPIVLDDPDDPDLNHLEILVLTYFVLSRFTSSTSI
jgi:hypothetical protein